MAFRVGQKVVCIHSFTDRDGTETRPVKGGVYTVRGIVDYSGHGAGLHLEEIVNQPQLYDFWGSGVRRDECAFCITKFRPVRTTSIDIFLKMLEPMPEKVDV